MQTNIRPLKEQDFLNVSNLVAVCFGVETVESVQLDMWQFLEETPYDEIKTNFLVSYQDEKFVGYCAYSKSRVASNIYLLLWSAVVPNKRHLGIATEMLDHRLNLINERADGEPYGVMVQTHLNPLYTSRGFVPITNTIKLSEGKDLLFAEFPVVV